MRYKTNIDLRVNSSHSKMINMIEDNLTVLDVGCACGDMGDYLYTNKNCKMFGIEYDAESLDFARQRNIYDELFHLNMNETEIVNEALSKFQGYFDYIVCGDVLEHLYDPQTVVNNLKPLLKKDGYFIISLPNIAHGGIKLNLLNDDFTYNEYGLLDRTHIRFFTKKSILDFFLKTKLELVLLNHVFYSLANNIENAKLSDHSVEIIEHIAKDDKSFIYQYIIKAKNTDIDEKILSDLNSSRMIVSGNELKGLDNCRQRTLDEIKKTR